VISAMKTGLALVAAVLLAGCSTVRFAYENADSYVRWKIATYVDLQGEAAEEADERVDEFHAWHRKNELPKYARLAHEASRRFADGLSREDVVWGYDSLREQARESLRKAGQLAAPLVDRLTPEQVAQIERRFAEDNRQYYRNHLRGSERERRAKRAKQMIERLEDWVGKLTQAQAERVREYVERAPALDELRDRDRKRIQRELLAIIRARGAQKNLPEHMANWERNREPGFVAALETWRGQYSAFMVDLDRMLTPEQRARALAHLRRYAEDFEALSAR
jgi:hypothetical protein